MSGGALRKRRGRCRDILQSVHRADIILIISCLFAAFMTGLFFATQSKAGSIVRISHDGMELKQIALHDVDQKGQTIYFLIRYKGIDSHYKEVTPQVQAKNTVEAEVLYYEKKPELPETGSYNLIAVADGKVTMEAADCRDQICVHHRPISSGYESIICLPHKLVVEISGGEKATDMLREQTDGEIFPGKDDEPLDGVTR